MWHSSTNEHIDVIYLTDVETPRRDWNELLFIIIIIE